MFSVIRIVIDPPLFLKPENKYFFLFYLLDVLTGTYLLKQDIYFKIRQLINVFLSKISTGWFPSKCLVCKTITTIYYYFQFLLLPLFIKPVRFISMSQTIVKDTSLNLFIYIIYVKKTRMRCSQNHVCTQSKIYCFSKPCRHCQAT